MRRSAQLLLSTLLVGVSFACRGAAPLISTPPATPSATASAPPTTTPLDPPPPGLADLDPRIDVDLRYATAHNFTGAPLPGYAANRGLLRPAAAAALLTADRTLAAKGVSLVVLDAYRPVRATLAMVAWAHRVHRSDLIGPYVASHSEHNLGVAVDVTLSRSGHELDMGAPFDTFGPGAHYPGASGQALENRTLLRNAMIAAGFHPYDFEWWHFSVHVPGAAPLDDVIR